MRPIPPGAVAVVAAGVIAAAAVWTQPPSLPPSVGQIQDLLPVASVIRGLIRVEMNGTSPLETAVVAVVPRYPGAAESSYVGFIVAYDEWRRRPERIYAQPLPGPIPLAPDAVPLDGGREAAVFSALRKDGIWVSRVLSLEHGRLRILDEGNAARVLAAVPPALPGVTWRYRTHAGVITAQTLWLQVKPRQPVRLALNGGGPTPVIIPDVRLDILEQGYRARKPGTYTIRILLPFAPDQGITLTIVVES